MEKNLVAEMYIDTALEIDSAQVIEEREDNFIPPRNTSTEYQRKISFLRHIALLVQKKNGIYFVLD